jgi:hypothetical protein
MLAIPLLLLPTWLFAQQTEKDTIANLIKKLGSRHFLAREAALESLKNRPEAEPALREAILSADLETRRRADIILDYYERRPLRELSTLVKNGKVDEFIRSVAAWPKGKFDVEVWQTVRAMAHTLKDVHEKRAGEKLQLCVDRWGDHAAPPVLSSKRITEATEAKRDETYFLRASEVDWDGSRLELGMRANEFDQGSFIVASGQVGMPMGNTHLIFAGGSVQLRGGDVFGVLVVSGGDVEIDCKLDASLIIACGKVSTTNSSVVSRSRIISGKTVILDPKKEIIGPNIIVENDANPFGFIHWTESKDKSVRKSK